MNLESLDYFSIEKLYLKQLNFSAPESPEIFLVEDMKPELEIELGTENTMLEQDVHEVSIIISAHAIHADEPFFHVEVEQSGIFVVKGASESALQEVLGSECPSILFPYAREQISDVVMRAGLPPLYISPVDFSSIYQEEMIKNAGQVKQDSIH